MAPTSCARRATCTCGIRSSPSLPRRGKPRSTTCSNRARCEMDPLKRAPYYWRIQEILHDQLPIHRDGAPGALRGVEELAGELSSPPYGASTSPSGSSSGRLNVRIARTHQAMTRFLIRRLLNMIPLIIGITFMSFLVMSLVPGNFRLQPQAQPGHLAPGDPPAGGAVRPRSAADGALLRSGCGSVLHLNLRASRCSIGST